MSDISLHLFDQLKGQFRTVDLHEIPQNDDGTNADPIPTENPDDAVYFTVKYPIGKKEYDITLSLADEKSLGVWYPRDLVKIARDADLKKFHEFVKGLRPFAQANTRTLDLFDIPKPKLDLEDFKINAKVSSAASQNESLRESAFSKPYGSTKTSLQRLGEYNLRIKHTKAVQENGRFRYIKRLYVENRMGERFMLPTTNLAAGRAMLRHYEQGGSMHDTVGQRISEMARSVDVARSFLRKVQETNALNEHTQDIVIQVKDYALETAHMLRRLQSRKVYEYFVQNIQEQSQVDISSKWLENLFTQNVLDEELGKLLPDISNIIINAVATNEN